MEKIKLQIQSVIYGNEKESLLKAVHSLRQAINVYCRRVGNIEVKLIYGDASPQPILVGQDVEQIEEVMGKDVEFQYHFFGYNTGTAKGHNVMAESSNKNYIMIMNPDVILEPGCLIKMLAEFKDERVGMVEARQTPLEHAKEYNEITGETEWASTACTIFKSEAFHKVNGFDAETFFLYCDDLDFSWMLRLNGYKIIYVPSAIVYHSKSLTLDGSWQPTAAEVYYSAEAAILLAYKWSNHKRVEALCNQFVQCGGESEKKAVKEFEKRKREGRLPSTIDEEHKIARFLGDEYCEMRFKFIK